MPKVITLDKIKIENIQLYRQLEDTGGVDAGGNPVMMLRWKLAINYTLSGDAKIGGNKIFTLTSAQQTQVKNFVAQFIEALKTETGVTTEID